MDSETRLDYALFQLTPTRTRFDLVLYCRGSSEKLASGLFQPFISHLKFARDAISKGGYSINLRPPTQAAPWFTKATFERFVRFVSTPAVLERFVSIENEILQIEVSIQANELSTGQMDLGSISLADGNIRKSADESVQEENSKIQLQRLLETRRTLLRKEQAMAFARGVVSGFEKDNIDDLISFADAYGAARLREACVNFKELCKKKCGDGLWMEELAAMEACSPSELSFLGTSGIVLTNETSAPNQNVLLNFTKFDVPFDGSKSNSTSSSDSKKDENSTVPSGQVPSATPNVQVPVTWPNQFPHYMYGFQGPIQHPSPYQGYPFPPMQPHYAANMQWPSNMNEAYHRKKSSVGKKEKYLNRKDPEHSVELGEDTQTESSDSDSENDADSNVREEKRNSSMELSHGKKHRKKSSRTVVIRNINYITPKRRNGENDGSSDESSSGEDGFIDEDSIKKKVDDAVGLLRKTHRSNAKQKGANKILHVAANGSNGATDLDFDDDSVVDAPKKGKGNENWDAFQNLLMKDEEATLDGVERLHPMDVRDDQITVRISEDGFSSVVDLESEKVPKQPMIATDSFVVTEREGGSEGRTKLENFENGENFRSVLKRADCTDEELLFSRRSEAGSEPGGIQSTFASESSITKTAKGEDWFIVNSSSKLENRNATNGRQTIFDGDRILPVGDHFHAEKHGKDLIDDSFMVQARSATDDLYDSQWRTDISMVADLTIPGNGTANISQDKQEAYEPDDLYMVLERESEFQSANDSWTVDFGIDESLVEANKRFSVAEAEKLPSNGEATIAKNNEVNGSKDQGKEARSKVSRGSIGKGKPELISKSRKPSLVSRPTVQKSKFEKEEEMRIKMEELLIQRQKRIAERTAATSGLAPTASKKGPKGTRETTNRIGSAKIRAT